MIGGNIIEIPRWVIRDPEWAPTLELFTTGPMQAKGVLDLVNFRERSIGFQQIASK